LFVKDENFSNDVAGFTSNLSGVMLYYELAEPVITDISDLLSADNFIGVEGGGTVFAKNEKFFDVPTTIVYQTEHMAGGGGGEYPNGDEVSY
jgi:hypothetical protein